LPADVSRDRRLLGLSISSAGFTLVVSVLLAGACQAEPEPMVESATLADGGTAIQIDAGLDAASPMQPIDAAPADASSLHFVDVGDYLRGPHDIDAWYRLLAALRSDFDDVCGDTFCEGDFTNYQSLRFRCSVERSSGILGGCSWVLAASNEEIAAATGEIEVSGKLFHCAMPVRPATSVDALIAALAAPDVEPIRAPLPGTDRSLFDGLADCL
jgi:hypothetical protein